jgi:hypothetical protein
MNQPVIIILNAITVVLVVISAILTFKLVLAINQGKIAWGWWLALPIIILYALTNRVLTLFVSTGHIYDPSGIIPAIMVFFWLGLIVFLYGIYKVTVDLIRRCG